MTPTWSNPGGVSRPSRDSLDENATATGDTKEPDVVVNPFLPLSQYIADGEPHVFGDRVYLFGSHDAEDGETYCALDYVFWSAPVDDLSSWTSRGVNYRASQDPTFGKNKRYMYAPDVVCGNDGRFYLYYCMAGKKGHGGYKGPISVAVCDEPDGTYTFLGHVRNPDGTVYDDHVLFDPAVINDDGVIRLYYGACYPFDDLPAITRPLTRRVQSFLFGKSVAEIKRSSDDVQGAMTVQLDDDMLTVAGRPSRIVPTKTKGTSFAGHAFWEASSIRKIDDTYYFVYSSFNSHELCYATSTEPDRDFRFRGTIVSNGDIGLDGLPAKDRVNQTGTNHGGIERINGQWYVFYHRNTHGSIWRRQACAEKITILPDGSIPQVAVTSSGLNNGPLPSTRTYPAVICSTLTNGRMPHGTRKFRRLPMVTHDHADRFVGGIRSGTTIGFKTILFEGPTRISVRTRGRGRGRFEISTQHGPTGAIVVDPAHAWTSTTTTIDIDGEHSLFLRYSGTGTVDFESFTLAHM